MSNVLVYSGPGVSSSALSHTLKTLRQLLPSYDVQCINAESLALDPWMSTTSLFVLPGGRDLPYVDKLSAVHRSSPSSTPFQADNRIREYVEQWGGRFLGICAGAYYASTSCEFEKGDAEMQVVGERTALQFFPGTCQGTVYPGFVYESDKGARMIEVQTASNERWTTYYNGGGAFMNAERYKNEGVEVLARYMKEEQAGAQSDKGNSIKSEYANEAAVIQCIAGKGKALLFGTHPEFPLTGSERPTQLTGAPEAIPAESLDQLEERRLEMFGQHMRAIGMEVKLPSEESQAAPKLTPILLTAKEPEQVQRVLQGLESAAAPSRDLLPSLTTATDDGYLLAISDTNDTLHFYQASLAPKLFHICSQADYLAYSSSVVASNADEARAGEANETEVDLNKVPKCFIAVTEFEEALLLLTPHWDAWGFYAYAEESRKRIEQNVQESWATGMTSSVGPYWGNSSSSSSLVEKYRLADVSTYAQVVTSTQTMLDKNYKFLTHLPSGFTSFATHQVSGRGRGKNAWISPLGCLQFSTLLHFSPSTLTSSGAGGIVFVQYLAGLAIVESVRSGMLGAEYSVIGEKIRIKWPNDVYAEVGSEKDNDGDRKGTFTHQGKRLAKMAGVLVNSQFAGNQISLVVGCGINTLNARPTTSLSDLINAHNTTVSDGRDRLAPVSQERFAGAILATFERMWNTFVEAGGSFEPFVETYRQAWLHSDQVTTLGDTVPPTPVRIVGITSDFGLLRSTPALDSKVDSQSAGSWASSKEKGQWIDLQPDGNSFDMLQNLIRRKS